MQLYTIKMSSGHEISCCKPNTQSQCLTFSKGLYE